VDRFLMGSVSRAVLRSAECPVLVVRGRVRPIRHVLIGLDGSANAGRAVDFVAGLEVPRDGRVSLVHVIDPVRAFSFGLLPATARSAVSSAAAALESKARFAARQDLDAAAQVLGGWTVASEVRLGVPLTGLLAAARARGADAVVVGARGVGSVKRLLLGSVAEGLVDRSPLPVLVVR
jgi:nucleotide-binding universal stress UspA family protein